MEVTRNLDCNTIEGKKFIRSQRETGFLIEKLLNMQVKHTTDDAEKFDCYMYSNHDSSLMGVAEIKTRPFWSRQYQTPCTLDKIKWDGYLITAEKLDILSAQSRKRRVSSFIFVNLPNDSPKKILSFEVSKADGKFLFNFYRKVTTTRYSCNDFKGNVNRSNAFLPIRGNKYFKSYDY